MPISFSSRTLFVAGSIVALSLLGAGCGSTKATINPITNTINTQQNGDAFSAGSGASIPASFPSYIPQYPNAKTVLAYSENGGATHSLAQQTSASFTEVKSFIEQLFVSQGFTEETALNNPDLAVLGFTKGTTRCQVNIAHQTGTTQIQTSCTQQ